MVKPTSADYLKEVFFRTGDAGGIGERRNFMPFRPRTIVLAVVVGWLLGAQVHAVDYTITDLGGEYFSYAQAINASGQVVGTLPNNNAFLWSGGLLQNIGTLGGWESYAQDINASGQVAGYSCLTEYTGPNHAFLYSGGTMQDLGTLGGTNSYGYGINASGQVAGYSNLTGSSYYHAFIYTDGSMQDLGTLGGKLSQACRINDNGQAVGYAYTSSGKDHAFLYSGGSMQDLGTLGGTRSQAHDINNNGQVVGWAFVTPGSSDHHACLWFNGTIQDLGTLGGNQSEAYGINIHGQVVGDSRTGDGTWLPFLYSTDTMIDLNSLLPPGTGWTLVSASDITDSGQIVGQGFNPAGDLCAFVLTPIPEPLSLSLLTLSGPAILRRRR
jgi:probable HAF family extracellular repeat protein